MLRGLRSESNPPAVRPVDRLHFAGDRHLIDRRLVFDRDLVDRALVDDLEPLELNQ